MRPVRTITAEDENYRIEPMFNPTDSEHSPNLLNYNVSRRDFVEPEPVGTIVLKAFRVTGYDQDCDGSAMARLSQVDKDGEETGWSEECIGLYPDTALVVSDEELRELFDRKSDR